MKFSDFIKKKPFPGQPAQSAAAPASEQPSAQEKPQEPGANAPSVPAPAEGLESKPHGRQWPARSPGQSAPAAMTEQDLQSRRQSAREAYAQAIQAAGWVIDNIAGQPIRANDMLVLAVQSLVGRLCEDNQSLLELAVCSTPKNYLYAHSVNTAVLAVWIGRSFGWKEDALQALGLCALLADIGMVRYLELASQPRRLTDQERGTVRSHPEESQKLLERIEDMAPALRQWLCEVIGQEHAWKSGRVLPNSSGKKAFITTMARLLGLCDIYEAMTHPRAWRKAVSPHEMIKGLLRQRKTEFGAVLVKSFVERLSLFPPGSFVRLSTHESGCVVRVRPGMPTRPWVELAVQPDGRAYSPPKIVDLMEHPTTQIVSALEESQAGIKDPDLLKTLEARHWWSAGAVGPRPD